MKTFNSYLLLVDAENHRAAADEFVKNLGITSHPADFLEIEPEGTSISIDQIRELKKTIFQKPLAATHKIVVIKHAQQLTREAQNSILKILEEPPEATVIIMTANTTANLLPTVISRVVTVSSQGEHSMENDSTQKNGETLLTLTKIEDAGAYIDNEIKFLFKGIVEDIENPAKRLKLIHNTELAREAKKMLKANVNAKFVLAGYLLRKK